MDPNLVSATLSPEDCQAINVALDGVREKLPFLIDLTAADRLRIPKSGDKSRAFIQKAREIANEYPQMFPAAFLDEMRKDAQLLETLSPITLAVRTLAKRLDDTTMQLGGEAFASARTVYSVTKAPFARAALRTASGDLAKRWGRRRRNVADAAPASAPAASPVPAGSPADSSASPAPSNPA